MLSMRNNSTNARQKVKVLVKEEVFCMSLVFTSKIVLAASKMFLSTQLLNENVDGLVELL
jgi:hypothetical protein